MEYIVRSAVSYLFLLLMARLMGARELRELRPIDFVAGIAVGTIVGRSSVDLRLPLWVAFLAVGTWSGLNILMTYLTLKSKLLRDIFTGTPTVLVESGKVRSDNLVRTRYNLDELFSDLRLHGVTRVEDVEVATLEPSGELSVVKNPNTVQTSTLETLNRAIAFSHAGMHNRAAVRLAEIKDQGIKEDKTDA